MRGWISQALEVMGRSSSVTGSQAGLLAKDLGRGSVIAGNGCSVMGGGIQGIGCMNHTAPGNKKGSIWVQTSATALSEKGKKGS